MSIISGESLVICGQCKNILARWAGAGGIHIQQTCLECAAKKPNEPVSEGSKLEPKLLME